jgi:hypothetical protein
VFSINLRGTSFGVIALAVASNHRISAEGN